VQNRGGIFLVGRSHCTRSEHYDGLSSVTGLSRSIRREKGPDIYNPPHNNSSGMESDYQHGTIDIKECLLCVVERDPSPSDVCILARTWN